MDRSRSDSLPTLSRFMKPTAQAVNMVEDREGEIFEEIIHQGNKQMIGKAQLG